MSFFWGLPGLAGGYAEGISEEWEAWNEEGVLWLDGYYVTVKEAASMWDETYQAECTGFVLSVRCIKK